MLRTKALVALSAITMTLVAPTAEAIPTSGPPKIIQPAPIGLVLGIRPTDDPEAGAPFGTLTCNSHMNLVPEAHDYDLDTAFDEGFYKASMDTECTAVGSPAPGFEDVPFPEVQISHDYIWVYQGTYQSGTLAYAITEDNACNGCWQPHSPDPEEYGVTLDVPCGGVPASELPGYYPSGAGQLSCTGEEWYAYGRIYIWPAIGGKAGNYEIYVADYYPKASQTGDGYNNCGLENDYVEHPNPRPLPEPLPNWQQHTQVIKCYVYAEVEEWPTA